MNPAWPAVRGLIRSVLVDTTPRDHHQPDAQFRRRRIVTASTLVVGAVLLGLSLATRPGNVQFYPLTLLVALTWTLGGFLSGPLHLGYLPWRGRLRRPVLAGVLIGLAAGSVFLAGGLLVRQVPPLDSLVQAVLAHARRGALVPVTAVTLLNGAAEEIFFRGAVFAAVGRRFPVLVTTALYAAVTLATANAMLVFAAVTLGLVLAAVRRTSGGILAPLLAHVTWSAMMLFLLDPLFH